MEFYTIFVIFRSMKLVVLLADISWDCVETLSDLFIQVLEYCPQIQQKIRLFTMEMWCKFQLFIIYSYNRRNYIYTYNIWINFNFYLLQQGGGYVIVLSVCLSVCHSVSRITEKVMSRFHWNLVLWSDHLARVIL